MANLTAASTIGTNEKFQTNWSLPFSFRINNATRIFAGAMTGLPGANALTSSRGFLNRWQDEVSIQWAGIAEAQSWTGGLLTSARSGVVANVNSVLGDTTLDVVEEITVETGPFILREVEVTGVSSQADVWRTLVFLNTDNFTDLTTTPSVFAPAVGKVIYFEASTTCSVQFFGMLRSVATS